MSNQSSAGQKAARAASAAVNIAGGAAAGGVYGAAVEAAKSFLPELIRLFVILLCVVILNLIFPRRFPIFSSATPALPIRRSSTSLRLLRSLTGSIKIWTVTSSLRFFAWWTAFSALLVRWKALV